VVTLANAPVTTVAAGAASVTTAAITRLQTSGASSGSSLAYTGGSRYILWLAIAGIALVLAGEGGRRHTLSRRRSLGILRPERDS
jgi:hypothetical protein